jgi:hypothetical protein
MATLASNFLAFARVAAATLAIFAVGQAARAGDPQLILACLPTEEALEKCLAKGGNFDGVHCKCIKPEQKIELPNTPCVLTCPVGKLDDKRCRCIPD